MKVVSTTTMVRNEAFATVDLWKYLWRAMSKNSLCHLDYLASGSYVNVLRDIPGGKGYNDCFVAVYKLIYSDNCSI